MEGEVDAVRTPLLWGTEEHLRQYFGNGVADLRIERKRFGPTKVAFERVGPEGEAALEADLRKFLEEANTAGDRALVLEPEYLEVVATRA